MSRSFAQVDVFTTEPYRGNPVAVVLDGTGVGDETLQTLARWTNLSETTFVLPPEDPAADYRVRIFTTSQELPFAGHPTLGTAHAWLEAGGRPREESMIVQECGAGLVRLRRRDGALAFAAPPLIREGPVDAPLVGRIADMLGLAREEIHDSQWVDNGPGWVAVLLEDAEAVLALTLPSVDLPIGVVGAYPGADRQADADGADPAFEVRAFFPASGSTFEDPVTGSLNASLASWLLTSGRARAPYTVSQGTALHRRGRVHISTDEQGTIWVGGGTITCLSGTVAL